MSRAARLMVSEISAPESVVAESSVQQSGVDPQGSSDLRSRADESHASELGGSGTLQAESSVDRLHADEPCATTVQTAELRTFDALYEAHFAFVWRTLRRFGVPASVAEDAAQDAFVVLHKKLAELRPEASAKAFLFSIARRVASDYRRAARRPQASLDAERTESSDRGPFDRAADREAGEALEAFLESLDEDKRVAFVLVELEGLTMPEVSQLLATNINTLYSRVRAARAQLMELLASQGVHHE